MVIHILSGDAMAEYSDTLGFSGYTIAFSEEMISGQAHIDIFGQEFCKVRAEFHKMNPDKYRKKIAYPMTKLRTGDDVHLWFGKDLFCQINMLTCLAFLEKLGIKEATFHEVFEDEMKEMSVTKIPTQGFLSAFESIVINKTATATPLETLNSVQDMYFEYHNLNGPLCDFIRENPETSVFPLTIKIIKQFAQYGLSDVQCKSLIERIRNI